MKGTYFMNWNFLQKQRAAISKVLAAAIVCTSAFHPVTTLPVYATDSVVSIDHKTKNLDDVQIHISSETMEIKPGNDIFLQVYIQNNTDHSIENGVLAWSDPDCVLENAYFNPSDEEDSVWISESEFLYGINLLPGDILNTSFSGTLDSFINVDEQCNIEFIFSSGEQNWQENFSFTSGIVNLLPIEPDHCEITAGELGSIALTFAINPSDIIIDLDSVPVSTPSNTNKYNDGTPSNATASNATASNATLSDTNPVDINLFSLEKVMLNLEAFGFKFKNLHITDISFSEMMEYANVTAEYTIDNNNMSGEYFCAINADIIISGINYQCGNLIRFNLISEENTQISTPSNSTGTDEFSHIYITYLDEINCLKDLDIQHNELIDLAQELQVRITNDYENDIISEAEYDDLTYMLVDFVYGGTGSIAEFAYGQDLIDPLIEEELTTQIPAYTSKLRSFRLIEDSGTKSISLYNTNDLEPTTSDSDTLPLSSAQIISPGGETVSDDQKVSVSKVITGSDTENTFDITLSVTTKEKIEEIINEPDLAVVLVMDISNSMNTAFGSTSRYAAAMTSAESFLDKFTSEAGNISKVGFVAFNTSAHKIFDLQLCNTATISESLKTTMNEKTKSIVKASDYASSNTRYTNIEAGLSMAYDMLKEANNSSKYIVFLSDGFPTTYMKSGTTTYTGYNPVSSSGTVNNDGVFYDGVLKAYCQWGTSYSDKAAIKARNIASTIKNDDIVIFSIGVDVSGQTIKQYITQSEGFSGVSVVDRGNISEDEFEIGASSDTAAFATWLKGDENDLSVG
ncbi:MAG: VWA domain-containing protein, partial [Lachnospiraceae bacterium]|nr:VWA domain-containing protein [Lachnospiraceae bacterium]